MVIVISAFDRPSDAGAYNISEDLPLLAGLEPVGRVLAYSLAPAGLL